MFQKYWMTDKDQLNDFYRNVSDNTDNMSSYGRWNYGVYPTEDIICEYVENGHMYVLRNGDDIVAAVALTEQNDSYKDVKWKRNLMNDEVMVVHVLAINPKYQRQGVAKKMMAEVIKLAKTSDLKAIRLDALATNIPAHRVYESLGFTKCDVQKWYADNTGWTDFYLFELTLVD